MASSTLIEVPLTITTPEMSRNNGSVPITQAAQSSLQTMSGAGNNTMGGGPLPPSYQDSTEVTDAETSGTVSSSLRQKILDVHAEHSALHQEIAPLSALPSLAQKTQEDLYTLKGKLTSLQTGSKRLHAQCDAAHGHYKKLKPAFGKRPLLPQRRRKWDKARTTWETLQAEHLHNDSHVEEMQRKIVETQAALEDARAGCESLTILETQLNNLDSDLFDGPTPSFPSEDSLEAMRLVLSSTARLLQAESERELRARPKLQKSLGPLQVVLAQLREALGITLDVGVPTDTRYTKQLFTGGSPLTVAKRITPLVQKAKTESGKGHTLFAEARGSQLLVRKLPALKLLDLDRLPSKASGIDIGTSISERGMHASLEVSYSQCQHQVTHVKKEIERSRRRSDFFRKRLVRVRGEEDKVKMLLRDKRRRIVDMVARGQIATEDADDETQLVASMDSAFNLSDDQDQEASPTVSPQEDNVDTDTAAIADEATMFQFKQDAAGNPLINNSQSNSLDPQSTSMVHTAPAAASRADSEEVVPTIRNPHLVRTETSDADGPLNPLTITRRSTVALRKIMRECVRECNALDFDDELPGYQYIAS